MTDNKLVEKIVMFRNELHRQNASMGISALFDSMYAYFGEQYRTIESQKEEIERLNKRINDLIQLLPIRP